MDRSCAGCLYSLLHPSYVGLFLLQLLPSLLVGFKYASFVYFGLLAVSTVYLGAKRQDIPDVRDKLCRKASNPQAGDSSRGGCRGTRMRYFLL